MLPVIIASYNRMNLLKQTIKSLKKNSDCKLQIIVVDSSTDPKVPKYLKTLKNITYYKFDRKKFDNSKEPPKNPFFNNRLTIGKTMNKGAEMAKPSKYIYFSANDMYFLPHWDTVIIKAFEKYKDFAIIGGRGMHGGGNPQVIDNEYNLLESGLQAGYSMMIKRETWDTNKHFPDYDEDSWLSYEYRGGLGMKLGSIDPPVVLHCGLTSVMNPTGFIHDKQTMEWDKNKYPEVIFE